MFEWLRRGRGEGEVGAVQLTASAVRRRAPDAVDRVGRRLLGTSPADKALLASLLAAPPAWSNDLSVSDLGSNTSESTGLAMPGAMSAGLRASLVSQLAFGSHLTKGD